MEAPLPPEAPSPPQRTHAAYLELAPAPAEGEPVREAAVVADPRTQTVFVPYHQSHEKYYEFLTVLIDKGFSFVSENGSGALYSRKLEAPAKEASNEDLPQNDPSLQSQ